MPLTQDQGDYIVESLASIASSLADINADNGAALAGDRDRASAGEWALRCGLAMGMANRLADVLRRLVGGVDLVVAADEPDPEYPDNMAPEIRAALTEHRELAERIERWRLGT